MTRTMRRLVAATTMIFAWVLVSPPGAEARPGGGSSFRSSSSGSRSSSGSSSGSRSSSGSSSGSRSSSGSSSRSDSGSRTVSTPPPPTVWMLRLGSGRERTTDHVRWAPGAPSLYAAAAPRPSAWPPPNEVSGGAIGAFFFVFFSLCAGVVAVVIHVGKRIRRRALGDGWSTARAAPEPAPAWRRDLEGIRRFDPDFSVAIFEDFVHGLFTEAHVAAGAGTLERMSPWLSKTARDLIGTAHGGRVDSVIVGAMRYQMVDVHDPSHLSVMIVFEANFTETPAGDAPQSYWIEEMWTLGRAGTARSRPPERARVFECPGCGAPLDRMIGGACRYCNRSVDGGVFDWSVESIIETGREQRPPILTGTTEEQGTNLPTIYDRDLQPALAALQTKDPAFSMPAFQARIGVVFATMQHAWSSLAWHLARPFLSDNLWQGQTYWIDAYRKSGLRNVNDRARILKMDLCRVTNDRWFDAITVRVHATGFDFTVRDADGAVVGGRRDRERAYTEYWTLIRGAGAKGAARTDAACPRCGAPLAVNMAGQCNHCHAKVSSGEFDWVLARIEQDEVYGG